jgi:glycosyltransferase involved in cell wall biosynthesis
MPTLSLVIPCYNEENTLHSIIDRVLQLRSDSLQLELIIVDDCSKDESWKVAQQLAQEIKELKIYRHEVNQGKGAALRTGFLQATGDFVGIQDADMEYNPQDYLIMLEPLLQNKADVVYGSRYLRPDTRRVLYYWHTWMNKTLTQCSNMFTNLDITDMETCYKLFRREVIQEIAPQLKENRFGFEPEVTAYVARNGYRVYECAIQYTPRTVEEGKKINWKDGVRALYCIFHYSASFAPLPMQLILYFLIGGFCAVMNLASFCFLNGYVSFSFATIISFCIAAILNYLLCISILFHHKAR